jgi:hypothetical protein
MEGGWAMTNPQDLDPTSQVVVNFAYDMMERYRRLEVLVFTQGKDLKRCRKEIDNLRESLIMSRIYEKLDPQPRS